MTRKNICEAFLTNFLNFKHLNPDPHSIQNMDPDSATQTNTDRDPNSKYGTGFSNTIGIRLCIQNVDPDLSLKPIRIRTRIQNTDPEPQS